MFSYYFLQYLDVGQFRSGASVPTLDRNTFRFLPVTFPPLVEQRQIARVLSAVQRAIGRQERLIALTAELKKALMHHLFTHGTRGEPLKQTEIGPVPESRETPIIGEFVDIAHGYAFESRYFTKAGPVVLTPETSNLTVVSTGAIEPNTRQKRRPTGSLSMRTISSW